jgi:integrase
MSVHKTKTGTWYVQYRVKGQKSPIKEYTGKGRAGKRDAEVRDAEIKLMKAKGDEPRATSKVYLDQLAQAYLDDAKRRRVSERYRKEFAALLNAYILPSLCHKPVDHLSHEDVMRVASRWENASTATQNRYMGYLRSVFRFGIKYDLTSVNPLAKWEKVRERKYEMRLTVADLQRIHAAAEPHLQWTLEVALNLGTRPGTTELFALRWDDVDYQSGTVHVRGTKTEKSDRIIPFSAGFRTRLLGQQRVATTDYLIEYNGKPVKSVKRAWATALRRAGITYRVRLYDVRHLFATTMLAGGADLAAVSKLLGHASIRTTQEHYYQLLQGEMERAVAKLPSLAPTKQGKIIKIG